MSRTVKEWKFNPFLLQSSPFTFVSGLNFSWIFTQHSNCFWFPFLLLWLWKMCELENQSSSTFSSAAVVDASEKSLRKVLTGLCKYIYYLLRSLGARPQSFWSTFNLAYCNCVPIWDVIAKTKDIQDCLTWKYDKVYTAVPKIIVLWTVLEGAVHWTWRHTNCSQIPFSPTLYHLEFSRLACPWCSYLKALYYNA